MRTIINKVLDQLEAAYPPEGQSLDRESLVPLMHLLPAVQDAYVELIQQALTMLMEGFEQESHDLLQRQRDALDTTFERIASLIDEISESDQPMLRYIVEYLFTRARLVEELKMFPQYGLELLDKLTIDESIDETISYMEKVMTGRSDLYQSIHDHYNYLTQSSEDPTVSAIQR
jgi:hypothetical protein